MKKNGHFFVTGTDTNAGKTVLSALLTAALGTIYWKPIQTGVVDGTDREAVRRWAEIADENTIPETYRFDPPVSPHLAARQAGTRIDLKSIQLPPLPPGARVVAEGAGGVLVPVNESELMLDLMLQLEFPVVVAARSSLGTINHTLLTMRALIAAGVNPLGVVMIGEENAENRLAIERYGGVPVIGQIPWLQTINRRTLVEVFKSSFEKSYFDKTGSAGPQ